HLRHQAEAGPAGQVRRGGGEARRPGAVRRRKLRRGAVRVRAWRGAMSELCLVTGGAGFIGSHLVEALTRAGRRVRVLDNFDTGHRDNLAGLRPAPEVVEADVGDPAAVARAAEGAGVVFHLAALASVQKSVEAPAETHRVCATGTLNVLD